MLRAPLFLRLVLCLACLVSATFAQTTFSRRTYAHSGLLRGDFNRDGKPDLLGSSTGNFRVLLNNGDGTFRGPVTSTQPGARGWLTTADFNRDGRTDLAGCQIQNPEASPAVHELAIWSGTGPGTFSQPRRFPIPGNNCLSVSVEDFDRDGKQDAAVVWSVRNPDDSPNNGITVFFGDGSGGVSHSVTTDHISAMSETGACSFSHAVTGNYDRSGGPDLMIATSCPAEVVDESTLLFAQGTGTGHFAFTTTDAAHRSLDLMKDEINQDSRLDLVVVASFSGPHASRGRELVFYINRNASGIPAWDKREVYGIGGDGDCVGSFGSGIAVDLNGDAIKDAAFTETFRPGDCIDFSETHNLGVMFGRADGSYGAPQKLKLASEPAGVVSADFDRDGRLDLALARASNLTEVFLNRNNIATCPANSTLRTVKICAPTTVSGNTLPLRANTTTSTPITGMKVYVDNSEAFFTPNDTINHKLPVPSGSHRITVRAWDGQGSFSSAMTVNAGGSSSCPAPSANRTINLCSPVNESTVNNPVKVMAAITTSNKYYGAKVYIDGKARHTTTSKQVNTSFTLSAGRHRVSVQAYDTQGPFTKTVFVNVR
jgi:hypothetical protein